MYKVFKCFNLLFSADNAMKHGEKLLVILCSFRLEMCIVCFMIIQVLIKKSALCDRCAAEYIF